MSTGLRPPSHTALAALPILVLDLETTGLSVATDRIVQIGAVAMIGAKILERPRIDQRIDPAMPIPPDSTRIHSIRDADVRGAPSIASYFDELRELTRGRVVVGHNIGFDLAVLRHEAVRIGMPWHEPASLDVARLVGALEPARVDLSLDALCVAMGIANEHRHDALADSIAIAQLLERLLPRLREMDVRTLGEAQALAERRADLLMREAQAGWHALPGLPQTTVVRPLTRVDSHVFARTVGDLMSSPPAVLAASASLRAASRLMLERGIGSLLVGEPGSPPLGIVTERDLLRAFACADVDPDVAQVATVMSAPVQSIPADEMLYRALSRMDRLRIRHLYVTDEHGTPTGMVSQRDLLHHRASSADVLGDALASASDAASLAEAFGRTPEAAAALLAESLGGTEVARVVSNEIRGLTERATQIAISAMREARFGDPPAPWCLFVLGSGGRGESMLGADQDNALIHAGSDGADAWFAELGRRVADLLDEAGLPRCNGGVMALNPAWRGTIAGWRSRVDHWLQRARPTDLLDVDIFFDLMPVAGQATLARDLREEAISAASKTAPFLALLADWVGSTRPAIGPLGMLRTRDGRIDLKIGALVPLVGIARTLALCAGSLARTTGDRLRDATADGRLSDGDAQALIAMHGELLRVILNQQLADLDDGVRPSGRVAVKGLTRAETGRMRDGLRRLDDVLGALRGAVSPKRR